MSSIITLLNSMAKRRQDERELQYLSGLDDVGEILTPDVLWWEPWPSRLGTINTFSNDIAMQVTNDWYGRTRFHGSNNFPYHLTGFVRDANGDPVSNAHVQLFRTSDDAFLRESVSQAGGQYDLGVIDNTTAHYIVVYRAGPDIMGTTVNTLTGA